MSILEEIIRVKQKQVEKQKQFYPIKLLQNSVYYESAAVSLKSFIKRADKIPIIAEFKRYSPSLKDRQQNYSLEDITIGYMQSGVVGLSILTESQYFGGKNQDLEIARKFNFCPILRKDFIIDPYQVIESKAIGADQILLIAQVLSTRKIITLSRLAKSIGLEVIIEIHSSEDLDKIQDAAFDLIGVNNRNLSNQECSIEASLKIISKLPKDILKISESGIQTARQANDLLKIGYDALLIGTALVSNSDPVLALRKFVKEISKLKMEHK